MLNPIKLSSTSGTMMLAESAVADEVLLRSFVESNDLESFETLVRRYQHEIYNYLRRYLGDDDLAEDAFQLTFVKIYQKVEQFDLERRFRPWLYGIATHQAIDLKRRNKRRVHHSLDVTRNVNEARGSSHAASIPDHRQPEDDPLEHAELQARMREAIDQVGEPGRSALELIYLQGLPYRDAAEVLDVPVGTVKSRVHAAIRKLAAVWKRNQDEEGNGAD
jgi:RNA polymerase sigma-70 factor, ECF subfamily